MRKSAAANSKIVGVDIGGANLKYCCTNGNAVATNFPMWQCPDLLAEMLASDLEIFQPFAGLAVTMTGELADCFIDRGAGVDWIVDQAVNAAFRFGVDDVVFYGTDGDFHAANNAKSNPNAIAAANWHALADFAARLFPAATTVVDIGSTTTDIIPLADGKVATAAVTDHDRLIEGSLVYVGCRRTPVCSLVDRLRFRGQACPVMNEVFATIDDALLLLEMTAEDALDTDTADNRSRTIQFAANRIARMIGLDRRSVSVDDARVMAKEVVLAATKEIGDAFGKLHRQGSVIIAGHGHELLRLDPTVNVEFLSDHIGPVATRCAPSYSVAQLYDRQVRDAEIRCGG